MEVEDVTGLERVNPRYDHATCIHPHMVGGASTCECFASLTTTAVTRATTTATIDEKKNRKVLTSSHVDE